MFNFERVGFASHHPVSLPFLSVQRSLSCRKDVLILLGVTSHLSHYMLAKNFCWREQSLLHLSNSKQCLKSLIEGRCGCWQPHHGFGYLTTQPSNEALSKQQRTGSGTGGVPAPGHWENAACAAQRHKWLNKGRAQHSWYLQKHYPEKEREMGPYDFTLLAEYLHNYWEPVTDAYRVRTTRCPWRFICRFPILLNGKKQGVGSWHPI